MNIGTWNVQGIKGKMEEITKELLNLGIEMVVLTETKKKGTGTEIINNYVHIFTGVPKHERAKRGVSIMIHKKHKDKITDFEPVNENIIRVNITINQKPVTILGLYAISDDEPLTKKDEFFEQVSDEIMKIGKSREIIVLGDLNSRVGRRINDAVVGPFGEINTNDNGERLIEMCQQHLLRITNGYFRHKDIHTYTWVQHTRNLKSVLDYVIIRQNTILRINDVRAYRGATCGSDHYIVRAKLLVPFRSQKFTDNKDQGSVQTTKQYNVDSLTNESTRILYQNRLDEKLFMTVHQQPVEKVYDNIVNSIKRAAEEAVGLRPVLRSKKLWWNDEIEELVDQKKKLYQKWLNTQHQEDRDQYLDIKRTTRRTINIAQKEMWDKKCSEINTYIGGKKCSESWKFMKNLKSDQKNKANVQIIPTKKWIDHYQKLLTENREEYLLNSPTDVIVEGDTIVVNIDQVKKAVRKLKNGRAAGPGGIPAELIKCGSEKLFEQLTWCINQYLNGDPVPAEWKEAYISSIHKKGNKLECSNYRGISVTSTMSRLYGRIIRDLIEQEYMNKEEEEQSGFRAGRTCTDNIFCLKQVIEKRSAVSQETHLMFIDLQKAYDTVPVKKLWKVLHETNVNHTIIRALKNLYDGTSSRVKIGNNFSEKFPVDKGLRQGCCVSPTLFKIYVARALYQWKRKCKGMGIDIGDTCLYTLQFADDQVIIANDKDDLQYMARKLQEEYNNWGLEINTQKTKYLPIGAEPSSIQLDIDEVASCNAYSYLGVEFDTSGKDDREIQKRITQARRIIGCLNGILWSNEIGKQRKYNIYETLIKSCLTYGAETWKITEQNRRKLEATEMDVFRRSLGISRRDRIRNDDVRQRMGIDGSIMTDIEQKQLIWYGHVQRMEERRLPKIAMNWVPPNRRKRGRPKKTWIEGIRKAMSTRDLREEQWNNRIEWKLGIGQRRKTF